MRRISLKSLMWYVSFIAVGLAALRNANDDWAGLVVLLTICTIGASTLGLIYRRGKERAWWAGFLLFAAGYLVLAFGPWFTSEVGPHMGTTRLLGCIRESASGPSTLADYDLIGNDNEKYLFIIDRIDAIKQGRPLDNDPLSLYENDLAIVRDRLIESGSDTTKGMQLSPRGQATKRVRGLIPGAANSQAFYRIGHCLFALLAGLIGAAIASRMYREPT